MLFPNAPALRGRGLGRGRLLTPSWHRAVPASPPTGLLQTRNLDLSPDSFGERLLCIIPRAVCAPDDDSLWKYFHLSGVGAATSSCNRSITGTAMPSERAGGRGGGSAASFWEEGASEEVPAAAEDKKRPQKAHKEAPSAQRVRLRLISPAALNPHIVNFLFN